MPEIICFVGLWIIAIYLRHLYLNRMLNEEIFFTHRRVQQEDEEENLHSDLG